jgi:hypothetical protein
VRRPRFVSLLWVLGGLALGTAPARAGTYEVISCAAAGGANHAWQSFNEDPATLVVGNSCASLAGGPEDGLFAVDRIPGPPHTPKDRAAGWRLKTPSGVRITRLTTQRYLGQRSAGEWFPYLKTLEGAVLDTCTIPGGEDKCESGEPVYDPFGPVATFTTDTTGLEVGVRCVEAAGTCGNGALLHAAWVALYSTRVEITDSVPPSVPQYSPPPPGTYFRGTESFSLSAADTTGIRRTKLLVDGATRSTSERACDYTYVVPCSNEPGANHALDTRTLPDGSHTFREVAEDPAGNQAGRSTTMAVDNTAPAAPLNVSVQHPADGPSTSPEPELSWRNPPSQVAPIAVAHWSVCRAAKTSGCGIGSRGSGLSGEVGRTGALGPPLANGEWEARLWLEDAAGNTDAAKAAGPLRIVVATNGRLRPRLKILRVRRRDNLVSIRGTAAARSGRLRVAVERKLRGRTHRAQGRATISRGRWTKRLRLRGRLAKVRRVTLVVRFAAQDGYKAQTRRKQVRR